MTQWLKYFLVGIAETAEKATQTLSHVLTLKSNLEADINKTFGRRSNSANALLQYLFKKPVIQVNRAKEITGLSYKAANDLVNDFVEAKILKEMTGQTRNRVFVFDEYMRLF